MELKLIEKTGHTEIKVLISQYGIYKKLIKECISQHGGKETKRSSKFIYFEVDTNLLN